MSAARYSAIEKGRQQLCDVRPNTDADEKLSLCTIEYTRDLPVERSNRTKYNKSTRFYFTAICPFFFFSPMYCAKINKIVIYRNWLSSIISQEFVYQYMRLCQYTFLNVCYSFNTIILRGKNTAGELGMPHEVLFVH